MTHKVRGIETLKGLGVQYRQQQQVQINQPISNQLIQVQKYKLNQRRPHIIISTKYFCLF